MTIFNKLLLEFGDFTMNTKLTLNNVIDYHKESIQDLFDEEKRLLKQRKDFADEISRCDDKLAICKADQAQAIKEREEFQNKWLNLKPNAACATKPRHVGFFWDF